MNICAYGRAHLFYRRLFGSYYVSLSPLMARLRGKASKEKFAELRGILQDWVESAQQDLKADGESELVDCGGLIAFYLIGEEYGFDK